MPLVRGVHSPQGHIPATEGGGLMKGQDKPKKVAKKQPQKSLKERRAAKRDTAAKAPRLDV
jgi:hypothetical protein